MHIYVYVFIFDVYCTVYVQCDLDVSARLVGTKFGLTLTVPAVDTESPRLGCLDRPGLRRGLSSAYFRSLHWFPASWKIDVSCRPVWKNTEST